MNDFQTFLNRALDPASNYFAGHRSRLAMRLLVGAGIAVTTLRLTESVGLRGEISDAVVVIVLASMVLDYALRLYAAPALPTAAPGHPVRARFDYMLSGAGLIDLLAFAPMIVVFAQGATIESVHAFGALWILKIARYSTNLALLMGVVWHARRQLLSVLLLFGVILVLTATAAHLLEGERQPEDFGSIAASLWWAIATLTTTGYGDAVPVSLIGRLLAGMVMISGFAVFALWAGIFANGFSQELRRRDFLRTWELVAKVPFFKDVGAASIAAVAGLLRPRKYPAGATIFWEGQRGDCMYFIVDGEVEVDVHDHRYVLESGDFFGEVALVEGGRRTGRVTTVGNCTLLMLDIADFHGLAVHQPELSAAIRERAAGRVERS
jgi:voltage-gated potassium channel